MGRYYSLKDYLEETYGKRLYKLSIDAGFTCPNRDGSKGYGGCIFCNEKGSGDFSGAGTISEQIINEKKRYEKKLKDYDNAEFIAYFQSFTNTYAPADTLLSLYREALKHEKIKVLSIATRADCLSDEIMQVLAEIKKECDLWVEIGLQTANDKTASLINRCYKTEEYDNAVKSLKKLGINVITHLILGLPGENHDDERNSLIHAIKCGTDGIKFHLLYETAHSRLSEYGYTPLEKDEYISRICDLITLCPKNTVIHRLTGDGDRKTLIAPLWSLEKIEVLNGINKYLEENDLHQGDFSATIF